MVGYHESDECFAAQMSDEGLYGKLRLPPKSTHDMCNAFIKVRKSWECTLPVYTSPATSHV